MGKKLVIALIAATMSGMFAGVGQAALIYATNATGPNVGNLNGLVGSPDSNFAQFTNGDVADVTFGANFNDGLWTDSVVKIQLSDWMLFNNLSLSAHRVTGGYDSLFRVIFTNQYEIGYAWPLFNPSYGPSGVVYDALRLTYSGNGTLDVNAVGVNYGAAPVPEPGTMLLLGSGLVGLAAYGRKKFRK